MQQYLILAHWSVSMHILPLSLILCVPLQVWVGEREREVGREREGDSLILNVTEFTEVNALSHLIQIIYKIMVSLPLRPVAARRLKIITSTQNAYVSLKCQRRSQCFHSTQAFCLNSNYLKQIRTQDCMLTVVLSCCLTLNVSWTPRGKCQTYTFNQRLNLSEVYHPLQARLKKDWGTRCLRVLATTGWTVGSSLYRNLDPQWINLIDFRCLYFPSSTSSTDNYWMDCHKTG